MKFNKILVAILAIGILFSSVFVYERNSVESGYKNVSMTLDYEELLKMSKESKKDVSYFIKEFKDMNIENISVSEMSLSSLKERGDYKIKTHLNGYNLIVEADPSIFDFIFKGFSKNISSSKIRIIGTNTLEIDGTKDDYVFDETVIKDNYGKTMGKRKIAEGSKLEFLGLGYLQSDIDLIKKSGMNVNLRPTYMSQYEGKNAVEEYFNILDRENIKQNYIIFAGSEILGAGKYNDYLVTELKKRNMIVGMIETVVQREHIAQKGLLDLVQKYNYNATRVFNIWDWVQKRYDYEMPLHRHGEEVMNSMFRAVTERNVRIIYFKPFIGKDNKYVTDMSIYKDRFKEFENRIKKDHNLVIGNANSMKDFHPNRLLLIPVIFGIIASLLILLENIFNISFYCYKNTFIGGLLLIFGGIGVAYGLNIKVELLNKMFALLGSITMPSISVFFVLFMVSEILKRKNSLPLINIIISSIVILAVSIAISLVGVMFEVSILSDIRFLLEMDLFKGVKLSQLAPLIFAIMAYLSLFGYRRMEKNLRGIRFKELIDFLTQDIKIWHLLFVGIIGVIGIIFIARTGHETNIKPSTYELLFRNMLELKLTARPRTKAFLIAYPSLMVMIYLAYKNIRWAIIPLMLAVAIGASDIVNTFSHLRAPLYLSFIRTNYEMLFGIIMGSLVVVIIDFIYKRLGGRNRNA